LRLSATSVRTPLVASRISTTKAHSDTMVSTVAAAEQQIKQSP